VRSVHVFLPSPASAEVSVHVRHGQRSRAIAARIERFDGRWTCTALEFG
jgi:rhodanese-related sulfurtransferase